MALLATVGIGYAIAGSGPRPAKATGATLAATLTVPGGGTVDTVWISLDGKRIAAARTDTDQTSDIYVWNTDAPRAAPVTLTAPAIKIGTSTYPAKIENIAFDAHDASMTMIGYPASTESSGSQTYVLDQWDLATGAHTTPWSIVRTSSNLSISGDNSRVVESVKGGVNVVTLLPSPTAASPLTLPDGSGLSATTSYDLDRNGMRMLYSPTLGTYSVWDFTKEKVVDHWGATALSYLSSDGTTALTFYGGAKNSPTDVYPPPQLRNLATQADITPVDARWEHQLVSSPATDAYIAYNTDGTVIMTERQGGKTDLWNAEKGTFLLTISDPHYRDDSDYAVVGPHGAEVVIFGDRAGASGYQYHQLDLWDTGLG